MKNTIRLTATLGLAAVLGGLVSLVPAQAQDFHIRVDAADIRRDERRLDDLYDRRRHEADHHDWRDVKHLDIEIAELKGHIEAERHDLRLDVRHIDDRAHRDFDRDRFHDGDGDRWHDR